MATLGSRGRYGTIADVALVAAIVIAPLAGGSVHLVMVPLLAVVVSLAYGATLLGREQAGGRQRLSWLPVGLLIASAFTLMQAVPIPAGLLSVLSPRAHEVRAYVGVIDGWVPLSYEPAITLRMAAFLALYAMIAHVAYERSSMMRGFAFVSRALVLAAMVCLFATIVHQLTGVDQILGVLPSTKPADRLTTTFVNPNHGAGFMLMASLAGVGLAVGMRTRKQRVKYLVAAMLAAVASALCLSRGALLALAFGFVLFVVLLTRRRDLEDRRSSVPALMGLTIALPLAGLVWKYGELLREFTGTEEDSIGYAGKWSAMKDAGPLIADHPILGIGRGSYLSVYPAYKTAPHQLTYSHPENVVVELLADWGVLFGAIAVFVLVWVIVRRIKHARNVAVLGATIGVAALTLQNLVDFSLEIPGIAIPVAAILGAAGVGAVREQTIERSLATRIATALLPVLLLASTTFGAMTAPDLGEDLQALADASWNSDPTTMKHLEPIARGHPANPVIAARMAYAAETADPPQLKEAFRWANRTMFLAPTYADGHLVTGRLLLRLGHREQGFTEMRQAWSLADSTDLDELISHVVLLARSPDELLEAIPRRDEVMDTPDEGQMARAVVVLATKGKDAWARELLHRVGRIESVRATQLIRLASAAAMVEELELAERALARRREIEPSDGRALHLLLDVLRKKGDTPAIAQLMTEVGAQPEIDPVPFLRAGLDLTLKEHRVAEARDMYEELRRHLSPTVGNQVELARISAEIELRDGRIAAASQAMDDAIRLAPANPDLRVQRARLFIQLGKPASARVDLAAALRLEPTHAAASALLKRLPEDR